MMDLSAVDKENVAPPPPSLRSPVLRRSPRRSTGGLKRASPFTAERPSSILKGSSKNADVASIPLMGSLMQHQRQNSGNFANHLLPAGGGLGPADDVAGSPLQRASKRRFSIGRRVSFAPDEDFTIHTIPGREQAESEGGTAGGEERQQKAESKEEKSLWPDGGINLAFCDPLGGILEADGLDMMEIENTARLDEMTITREVPPLDLFIEMAADNTAGNGGIVPAGDTSKDRAERAENGCDGNDAEEDETCEAGGNDGEIEVQVQLRRSPRKRSAHPYLKEKASRGEDTVSTEAETANRQGRRKAAARDSPQVEDSRECAHSPGKVSKLVKRFSGGGGLSPLAAPVRRKEEEGEEVDGDRGMGKERVDSSARKRSSANRIGVPRFKDIIAATRDADAAMAVPSNLGEKGGKRQNDDDEGNREEGMVHAGCDVKRLEVLDSKLAAVRGEKQAVGKADMGEQGRPDSDGNEIVEEKNERTAGIAAIHESDDPKGETTEVAKMPLAVAGVGSPEMVGWEPQGTEAQDASPTGGSEAPQEEAAEVVESAATEQAKGKKDDQADNQNARTNSHFANLKDGVSSGDPEVNLAAVDVSPEGAAEASPVNDESSPLTQAEKWDLTNTTCDFSKLLAAHYSGHKESHGKGEEIQRAKDASSDSVKELMAKDQPVMTSAAQTNEEPEIEDSDGKRRESTGTSPGGGWPLLERRETHEGLKGGGIGGEKMAALEKNSSSRAQQNGGHACDELAPHGDENDKSLRDLIAPEVVCDTAKVSAGSDDENAAATAHSIAHFFSSPTLEVGGSPVMGLLSPLGSNSSGQGTQKRAASLLDDLTDMWDEKGEAGKEQKSGLAAKASELAAVEDMTREDMTREDMTREDIIREQKVPVHVSLADFLFETGLTFLDEAKTGMLAEASPWLPDQSAGETSAGPSQADTLDYEFVFCPEESTWSAATAELRREVAEGRQRVAELESEINRSNPAIMQEIQQVVHPEEVLRICQQLAEVQRNSRIMSKIEWYSWRLNFENKRRQQAEMALASLQKEQWDNTQQQMKLKRIVEEMDSIEQKMRSEAEEMERRKEDVEKRREEMIRSTQLRRNLLEEAGIARVAQKQQEVNELRSRVLKLSLEVEESELKSSANERLQKRAADEACNLICAPNGCQGKCPKKLLPSSDRDASALLNELLAKEERRADAVWKQLEAETQLQPWKLVSMRKGEHQQMSVKINIMDSMLMGVAWEKESSVAQCTFTILETIAEKLPQELQAAAIMQALITKAFRRQFSVPAATSAKLTPNSSLFRVDDDDQSSTSTFTILRKDVLVLLHESSSRCFHLANLMRNIHRCLLPRSLGRLPILARVASAASAAHGTAEIFLCFTLTKYPSTPTIMLVIEPLPRGLVGSSLRVKLGEGEKRILSKAMKDQIEGICVANYSNAYDLCLAIHELL